MSDLVFKHIPEEGFDPNTGFSERTSNPTPSRRSSVDGSIPTAPTEENNSDLRLSHPMPSGRSGEDLEAATIDSRASNPTPTRRRTMTSYLFRKFNETTNDFIFIGNMRFNRLIIRRNCYKPKLFIAFN